MKFNSQLKLSLMLASIACSAPRGTNQNCLTQFSGKGLGDASQSIQLQGSSYNGGFIANHAVTGLAFVATANGSFVSSVPPIIRSAHFLVAKTESSYKITAFSIEKEPQYANAAAIDLMMFYKGGYLKIPVKSPALVKVHKIYRDSKLGDAQGPQDSEQNIAYDFLRMLLVPDINVRDYFEYECPDQTKCHSYLTMGIHEFEVPLNLLNMMIYDRYNKEINAETDVKDIQARSRWIAKYREQIVGALDHAAALSDIPVDQDMRDWYDLQKQFTAVYFKAAFRLYFSLLDDCALDPAHSPLCKAEFQDQFRKIIANDNMLVDNGRCEKVEILKFFDERKVSTSHSLKTCGGIDLGEFSYDLSSYDNDMDRFDAYIEAESRQTALKMHALYRKILAKGQPIHAATNYAYEPTFDAAGVRIEEIKKVFYYEFDIAKPAVFAVTDADGPHAPVDFLKNLSFKGTHQGTALLVENIGEAYDQFNIYQQVGGVYTIGGWPLHFISIGGPEDTGGQIIPPPPLPDLEEASRSAAPAATPQASADPAPIPTTSATPPSVTPPAAAQPDPTPIAGGPTTAPPAIDPVITPNPAPPATQPVSGLPPSPSGPTDPVLVDEPIAAPPSADPGALPGDAVASQAPAADSSPMVAQGPAPIIIGQATSEPGSIGGLGSRGDQLDPAAQSEFGCD
jgi:hypothetical protein